MENYQETRVRWTNTQLKSAARNKTEITLRLNKNNFDKMKNCHKNYF